MAIHVLAFLLAFQVADATPRLNESDYVLLRKDEAAPFSGVLLLEKDYRQLRTDAYELVIKEKDLSEALERLDRTDDRYKAMRMLAEDCSSQLERIADESPSWYESVEFWVGAVIGAGLTIVTVLTVEELK